MKISVTELEEKFFAKEEIEKLLNNREKLVEQYNRSEESSRWTTYFMLLGTLSASGRMDFEEYQKLGPQQYSAKQAPSGERLFVLTALIELLK